MHFSAWDYTYQNLAAIGPRRKVLEFGARDVNGSIRRLFIGAEYVGLDIERGIGVDVVGFPGEYVYGHRGQFDTVVCLETLEHDPDPRLTVQAARQALVNEGGVFIVTTAATGRRPHSGVDGGILRAGEHYANVRRTDLEVWLLESFGERFEINEWGTRDIRALAWTGERPNGGSVEWERRLAKVQFPR